MALSCLIRLILFLKYKYNEKSLLILLAGRYVFSAVWGNTLTIWLYPRKIRQPFLVYKCPDEGEVGEICYFCGL